MNVFRRFCAALMAAAIALPCPTVMAQEGGAPAPADSIPEIEILPAPAQNGGGAYHIRAGDVLTVAVWKEPDLAADVIVRPDGGFSFPLAGDVQAEGHSVEEVRILLGQRLRRYLADPVITVAIKQSGGSRIYVVGKVNRPGDFPLSGPVDVMQALGLAGGATPFASLNDIQILRREQGQTRAIPFRYRDIERGRHLEQNILLSPGDTVVVP